MRDLVYLISYDFLTKITFVYYSAQLEHTCAVYNFTHFGHDCATGCLQNERACLFESM